MPMTSAPPSIARRASSSRSSPGWRTTGSMPRRRHSSTRPNRSTLPPPDFAFMRRTPCAGGRHRGPRRRLRSERPPVAPERVAHEEGGPAEQREHHDQRHAVVLGGQHDGDGERQEHDGGERWPHLGSAPCAWPRPRPWRSPAAAAAGPGWPDRHHLGGPPAATTSAVPTSTRAPTAAARRIGSSADHRNRSCWSWLLVRPFCVVDLGHGFRGC